MSYYVKEGYASHPSRSISTGELKKGDLVVVEVSINAAGNNDPAIQDFTKIGDRKGNGNYLYYRWIESDLSSLTISSSFPSSTSYFSIRYQVFRGLDEIEHVGERNEGAHSYNFSTSKSGVIVATESSSKMTYEEFTDKAVVNGIGSAWGSSKPITTLIATQLKARGVLIQDGEVIKTFSDSWIDVGSIPFTSQIFKDYGMSNLDNITDEQWKAISQDSKIIAYTESNNVFTVNVTVHSLYDNDSKLYHGTGIIETEMEELPERRKFLMINAEHEESTFKYSLNNGSTWTSFEPGDVIDITSELGNELKIQIDMPTDTAKLKAISYAWA